MYQLPKAMPDELLLSRLIRFITTSGISSSEFLQTCFGSVRTSLHPFLTSGLRAIARKCNEDANVLLNEQTLTPLFCFYLPVHGHNLQKMMLTNNGAKAFRASQLASFGSGHSLGLKSCPLCVRQDLSRYGISYWHRSHQIPGVDTCGYHGAILSFLRLTQRQRLIKQLLPIPVVDIQYSSSTQYDVANFSTRLLSLLTASERTSRITDIYRYWLKVKGYLTHSGRVRRKALMQDFCKHITNHSRANPTVIPRGQEDFRYVSQLLEVDGSHHPYRHLLFGTWLFDDVDQIFNYPFNNDVIKENVEAEKVNNKVVVGQKCLAFLKAGKSLAQISRETGKSRCYLKRLALLNELSVNLKPKFLTQEVIDAICSLAYAGFHRSEIAKRCDVGIGSVEQTISSQAGLVEKRKQYHFESSRRRNRLFLLRYIADHPDSIRNVIKKQCCSAFFWLYSNDRQWLEEHLPKPRIARGRY